MSRLRLLAADRYHQLEDAGAHQRQAVRRRRQTHAVHTASGDRVELRHMACTQCASRVLPTPKLANSACGQAGTATISAVAGVHELLVLNVGRHCLSNDARKSRHATSSVNDI